jgi:hypothetical protein
MKSAHYKAPHYGAFPGSAISLFFGTNNVAGTLFFRTLGHRS